MAKVGASATIKQKKEKTPIQQPAPQPVQQAPVGISMAAPTVTATVGPVHTHNTPVNAGFAMTPQNTTAVVGPVQTAPVNADDENKARALALASLQARAQSKAQAAYNRDLTKLNKQNSQADAAKWRQQTEYRKQADYSSNKSLQNWMDAYRNYRDEGSWNENTRQALMESYYPVYSNYKRYSSSGNLEDSLKELKSARTTLTGGQNLKDYFGNGAFTNNRYQNPDYLTAFTARQAQLEGINGNPKASAMLMATNDEMKHWYELKLQDDQNRTRTADEYLDEMYSTWETRYGQRNVSYEAGKLANEHPIIATIGSVVANSGPLGLYQLADNMVNAARGKDINPYSWGNANITSAGIMKETVANNIDNPVARLAYRAVTSAAESMAGAAMLGGLGKAGNVATKAALAATAMTSRTNQELMKGTPQGMAILQGAIDGGIEYVTETLGGIDKFLDKIRSGDTRLIINTLKQMASEGAEEGVGDILRIGADAIMAGVSALRGDGFNLYSDEIYNYERYGYMSEEEAVKQVIFDKIKEIGSDTLIGGVSGGIMGGTATAVNYGKLVSQGQEAVAKADGSMDMDAVQSLIDRGLNMPNDTLSHRQADLLQQKLNEGKAVTPREAAILYANNVAAEKAAPGKQMRQVYRAETDPAEWQAAKDEAMGHAAVLDPNVRTLYETAVEEAIDNGATGKQAIAEFDRAYTSGFNKLKAPQTTYLSEETVKKVMDAGKAGRKGSQASGSRANAKYSKANTERLTSSPAVNSERILNSVNNYAENGAKVYPAAVREALNNGASTEEARVAFNEVYNSVYSNEQIPSQTMPFSAETIAGIRGAALTDRFAAENKSRADAIPTRTNAGVSIEDPVFRQQVERGRFTETLDFMNEMGKLFNKEVSPVSSLVGKDSQGNRVEYNGQIDLKEGHIKVALDTTFGNIVNRDQAMRATLGHELAHEMRRVSPKTFEKFTKAVIGSDIDQFNSAVNKMINDTYKGDISRDAAQEEVLADYIGNRFFSGDIASLKAMVESIDEMPTRSSFIQHIIDMASWIKSKLTGQQVSNVQKVEDEFKRLFKETQAKVQQAAAQGTTYHVGEGIKYSPKAKQEYDNAPVNNEILALVNKVRSGNYRANETIRLGEVPEPIVAAARDIYGVDVSGYSMAIEARQLAHILKRHGEQGKADMSMKDDNDIAKMEFALKNSDEISPARQSKAYHYSDDGKTKNANTLLLEKAIGEKSYYAVQTAVETKNKTLYVVSAWIGKPGYKDEASQVINAKSPDATSETESANASMNNISQPGNNNKTENDVKEATQSLEANGVDVSADGNMFTKGSRKTWDATDKDKIKTNLLKMGFAEAEVNKWIDDVNSVASIIAANTDRLDYFAAPNQKFLKANGDYYKKTLDASTLCAKRLLYQGTYDAIMHQLPNTPLYAEDVIRLRQLMKDMDHEVPCGICYVESRRKALGKYASEWLAEYDGEYVPTLDQVVTSDGLEALRTEHPQTYTDFVTAMKKKGTASPKVVELRTEYREDLKNLPQSTVDYLNTIGGLRINSFSDFETPHLIDFMQAVTDMAGKGLKGMAYTKVPAFAWVFGDTGIKINMSLIVKTDANGNVVRDDNGRIVFDEREGINPEEAQRLREAYPNNVGTIAVAKDMENTLELLNDDRVDFVIPFHRSGWSKAEYVQLGLKGYSDFATGHQETGIYPSQYWDYSKTGKENAEEYLRRCAEAGITPVFEQLLEENEDGSYSLKADGSTDNYWKLLVEGRMYNTEGVGVEQQPVKPNFNMEKATEVLNSYDGDPNKLPVANDVVEAYVKEYKAAHGGDEVKYSRRSSDSDKNAVIRRQQETIDRLRHEMVETHGVEPDPKAIADAAVQFGRDWQSTMPETEIKDAFADIAKEFALYRRLSNQGADPALIRSVENRFTDKCTELANKVVKSAAVLVGDNARAQELKQFVWNHPIQNDLSFKKEFGEFPALREAIKGKIKLAKDGMPINRLYESLNEQFSDYPLFQEWEGETLEPVDMLLDLLDLINDFDKAYNPYDTADAVDTVAAEIMNTIFDAPVSKPTFADRKAAEINAAKAETAKAREQARKQTPADVKAYYEAKLNDIREQRDRYLADLVQAYKDRSARAKESEERARLLRIMKRLDRLGKKSNDAFRAEIQDIVGKFDLVAQRISNHKAQELTELADWVRRNKDNADTIITPQIADKLARLDKQHISELRIGDVRAITEALLEIEHRIRTENRIIGINERRNTVDIGKQIIQDVRNAPGTGSSALARGMDKFLINGLMRPETEFLRLVGFDKNSPLYEYTFGDKLSLLTGQKTMQDYQREANEHYFRKYLDDKAFMKSITGKNARAIEITGTDEQGKQHTVKVTPDFVMAMYMHAQNVQNLMHICNYTDEFGREVKAGGMTVPDYKLYKDGKKTEAHNAGTKLTFTRSQFENQLKGLTPKEMEFIKAAQRYYSEMSQPRINDVSEKLLGYSLAKVDNYFRINTDPDYRGGDMENLRFDGTIEGMGWTKERVNGKNPILLIPLSEQLQKDIVAHSKYVGMAIPIRNFSKIYGITENTYAQNADGKYELQNAYASSVIKEINKKHPSGADTNYIRDLLADIQNPVSNMSALDKVFAALRSKYAGSVLTLNLGVALKQAASFPTAAAEIGWGPILKTLPQFGKAMAGFAKPMNQQTIDFISKYSPLMRLRTEGMSTQELADMQRLNHKIPGVLNWIQNVDVGTVAALWKASEEYVKQNFKDLKPGTEEFYQKVGDVHTRVITKTQPNYSELQRPGLLRSKSEITKTLMMFKTQPFQNFNILYEAVGSFKAAEKAYKANPTEENKAGRNEARKRLAWAVSSQVVSNSVFAAMQVIWDIMRRKEDPLDDEDKNVQRLNNFFKNMISSWAGMVPGGSQALEVVEKWVDDALVAMGGEKYFDNKVYGFELDASIEGLNKMVDLITNIPNLGGDIFGLIKGDGDKEEYLRDLFKQFKDVSTFFGIPTNNVMNLTKATMEWAMTKGLGYSDEEARYLTDRYLNGVNNSTYSKKHYAELAIRAGEDTMQMFRDDKAFDSDSKTAAEYLQEMQTKAEKEKFAEEYGSKEIYVADRDSVTEEAFREFAEKYAQTNDGNGSRSAHDILTALAAAGLSEDEKEAIYDLYDYKTPYEKAAGKAETEAAAESTTEEPVASTAETPTRSPSGQTRPQGTLTSEVSVGNSQAPTPISKTSTRIRYNKDEMLNVYGANEMYLDTNPLKGDRLDEFNRAYAAVSDNNDSVSQKELAAALNMMGVSLEEGEAIWAAYSQAHADKWGDGWKKTYANYYSGGSGGSSGGTSKSSGGGRSGGGGGRSSGGGGRSSGGSGSTQPVVGPYPGYSSTPAAAPAATGYTQPVAMPEPVATAPQTPYTGLQRHSEGGNVDLTYRPVLRAVELRRKGWGGVLSDTVRNFVKSYFKDGKALNFTPIVLDKDGKYVRTLSPNELREYAEAVLKGEREDDLKLQVGSAYEGTDALAQAEKAAAEIEQLDKDYTQTA